MPASQVVDQPRGVGEGPGLLSAVRRYPLLVLAAVLVAVAVSAGVTALLPTRFTADAKVVLGDSNDATVYRSNSQMNAAARAQDAAQLMRSDAVYDRASELLDGAVTPGGVEGSVSVTPADTNPMVTVTATRGTAALARDVANAMANAYLDVTKTEAQTRSDRAKKTLRQLQVETLAEVDDVSDKAAARVAKIKAQAASIDDAAERNRFVQAELVGDVRYQALVGQLDRLNSSLADLRQKLLETQVDSELLSVGVDTVYKATAPQNATSPNLERNLLIGGLLGLMAGVVLAWRRLDRSRGLDHVVVAETLGAPQLGRVDKRRELRQPVGVVDFAAGDHLSDDFRVLAASLVMHAERRGLAGAVVTSAEAGAGKTVLAVNLAAAADWSGHDVVLVDADTRNPAVTDALSLDAQPGLLDLLAGTQVPQYGELAYGTDGRSLPVIPVGRERATEEPRPGLPALKRADGTAPLAILDSPAVLEDPLPLWLAADRTAGLVIVVSRGSTLADLATLRSRVELAEVHILGFIVNDHQPRRRPGKQRPVRQPGAAVVPAAPRFGTAPAPGS